MAAPLRTSERKIWKAAALIGTILLAACVPAAPPKETHDAQPAAASVPTDAVSCRLAGGVMKPVGRLQMPQCVLSYADAGRSCSSGDQCAGDCRVVPGMDPVPGQRVAGQCQATSDRFGCSTRVENGRAEATICID
jgi:hypothetical protein